MAKKQKITSTMIAKAMELAEAKPIFVTCGLGEDAIEVPIKNHLTLGERAMMVADITNMVFIKNANGVTFCPAFKKFAIEFNIVSYFTDVALSSSSDKANNFLEESGLAEKIIQALPEGYVAGIISDACEAIEFRKHEMLKNNKLDDVLDKVLGVVQAVGKKVENIDLPQIIEFIEKYMPEFKGQFEQLISTQTAGVSVD